jgi:hypothetical protein
VRCCHDNRHNLSSFRAFLCRIAAAYRHIDWVTPSKALLQRRLLARASPGVCDARGIARRCIVLKEDQMDTTDTVIAVFADHAAAEAAVKQLAASGFEMKHLSVVGKGYQTEEKVVGFYSAGDRIKFWGTRGAFWGGFWGLFLGGLFMTIPVVGHVVVLGYLATVAVSAIETAVVVGGLSALGAALYSIGVPKDSVIQYENAVKADGFLVMAHGTADEMARAKAILGTANPSRLDVHAGLKATAPVDNLVHAEA